MGFYCLGMQGTSLFPQYLKRVLLPIIGTAAGGRGVCGGWICSLPSRIVRRTVVYGRGNIVKQVGGGPSRGYDPLLLMSFFDHVQKGQ
jgi:hypothetical protein